MDLIASNVLGSSSASVTFSSIPGTYRDLVLVVEASATALIFGSVTVNGDFSTYPYVAASNYNNAPYSEASGSDGFVFMITSYANTNKPGLSIINFLDYSATDKHKTVLSRSNNVYPAQVSAVTTAGVEMVANRWPSTNAITSMQIRALGGSWSAGSSFYLYGIAG